MELEAFRPAAIPDLVRLGRDHDGGYVVAAPSIDHASLLLSFGVNDDVSFEQDACDRQPALKVVCYDPTVNLEIIRKRSAKLRRVGILAALILRPATAKRKFARARRSDEFEKFFKRHNTRLVQKWVGTADNEKSISLASTLDGCIHRNVFMKMDIEGSEYSVFEQVLDRLHLFTGFALELHKVSEHLFEIEDFLRRTTPEFYIAHTHGNNFDGYIEGSTIPKTIEMTFVRKSYYPENLAPSRARYPMDLDMPNHHRYPDMVLSFE